MKGSEMQGEEKNCLCGVFSGQVGRDAAFCQG